MKIRNPFSSLSHFEWKLLGLSLLCVILSAFFGGNDPLSVIGSVIGVTALIFVAKGDVFGQILCIIFSVTYSIISYRFQYYGEMITYAGMTAPMALMSVFSWIKHPYKRGESEVEVQKISFKQITVVCILATIVTVGFYFLLKILGNANLIVSTISVLTSFLAAYLTFLRSPYYALAYAANDLVLIVLWIVASVKDKSYVSTVICFVMFLLNDVYGFVNWQRMFRRQNGK